MRFSGGGLESPELDPQIPRFPLSDQKKKSVQSTILNFPSSLSKLS
jgi:hypothetical protein